MNWWSANRELVFVITLLISVVLMCIPPTCGWGVGMFMMAWGFAISGAVVGGVIAG